MNSIGPKEPGGHPLGKCGVLQLYDGSKHVGEKTNDEKVKAQRDQDDRQDLCNLVGGGQQGPRPCE